VDRRAPRVGGRCPQGGDRSSVVVTFAVVAPGVAVRRSPVGRVRPLDAGISAPASAGVSPPKGTWNNIGGVSNFLGI
jgi:hypothetical protein